MFKLFKTLRLKDYLSMLICSGLIVFQVWLEIEISKSTIAISNLLIVEGTPVSDIWREGLLMLGCTLGSVASAIASSFVISRLATSFSMRLRANVFCKIERFSLEQIKSFSTSSLITRTTNDIFHIQQFFAMGLQAIIKAPITAIWAILEMSSRNWQCSIATGIAVAIIISTISIVMSLALPKFKKMQKLTDNINKVTRENLEGIRVVRAYNAENFESQKFEKANSELTKTGLFSSRVMSAISPVMTFVTSTLSLSIYWIGAVLISQIPQVNIALRSSTLADVMGFSSFAMQVVMSFTMLTMIFIMMPRATVSAKRINEVLNTPLTIIDGSFNGTTQTQGQLVFDNVSFKYPDADEYVIEDVSFTANKGETVAFIGSTGSGKSTLINLIPRFYDVSKGNILIDGINIKDYKLECLRNKLGYISQKAVMFSGSVIENLTFGENGKPEQTEEELNNALKIACGFDFVEKMPEGKNSYIAEGGTNVSGGQKQRLSIARALARKPEFLIFDDSFSALDYKTDKKLRKNLDKHLKDTTRLVVAQRIGTIKDADLIVVLDEGKVVGKGSHKQLMETCSVYKEIALSQLSKEELENVSN